MLSRFSRFFFKECTVGLKNKEDSKNAGEVFLKQEKLFQKLPINYRKVSFTAAELDKELTLHFG